jgi:hypothetical protein
MRNPRDAAAVVRFGTCAPAGCASIARGSAFGWVPGRRRRKRACVPVHRGFKGEGGECVAWRALHCAVEPLRASRCCGQGQPVPDPVAMQRRRAAMTPVPASPSKLRAWPARLPSRGRAARRAVHPRCAGPPPARVPAHGRWHGARFAVFARSGNASQRDEDACCRVRVSGVSRPSRCRPSRPRPSAESRGGSARRRPAACRARPRRPRGRTARPRRAGRRRG